MDDEEEPEPESLIAFRSKMAQFACCDEHGEVIPIVTQPKKKKIPRKGYVYLITNPSLPGVCKIGRTSRSVKARLEELYNTSMIYPFQEVLSKYVMDSYQAEAYLHKKLASRRVTNNREFFYFNSEKDLATVKSLFDTLH